MRVLYCKSTEMRKPDFQIYTSIVEDGGKRYAVKQNVYDCDKRHIKRIGENYDILRQIYGDSIIACDIRGGKAIFPFINGGTYGEYLRNMLLLQETEELIRKSLDEWRKLLQGSDKNLTVFDNTEKFKSIFGDAKELVGDKALSISNFDCIADNIILTSEGNRMIDYEWVFDFPIPEELLYYRLLKDLFVKNKDIIGLQCLLSLAGVDYGKAPIYDRLLQKFESWISYDYENNIDYVSLGKNFTKPKILAQNMDARIEYQFPFGEVCQGKNIAIYGAGAVGMSYYLELKRKNECNIIAWVDKNYTQYKEQGFNVDSIDELNDVSFDFIIIAIYNNETAHRVEEFLTLKGIAREKILWQKPQFI